MPGKHRIRRRPDETPWPPAAPATTVDVIACGACAALERIDPLTLLASATQSCTCGCGWDELVCQICGKPVGIRTTLGRIDLGDMPGAAAGDAKGTAENLNSPARM